MLNKRGATLADIISFWLILLGGSIVIMGLALFVVSPAMGERAKGSISEDVIEFNNNIFLFNYLRYPVGEKTMADLVIQAYAENNYALLETETTNFLNGLYSQETRVCCRKVVAGGPRGDKIYYSWKEEGECSSEAPKGNCVKWRIHIDDKLVINKLDIPTSEKTIHEAYIPNYYGLEPIKFTFILY